MSLVFFLLREVGESQFLRVFLDEFFVGKNPLLELHIRLPQVEGGVVFFVQVIRFFLNRHGVVLERGSIGLHLGLLEEIVEKLQLLHEISFIFRRRLEGELPLLVRLLVGTLFQAFVFVEKQFVTVHYLVVGKHWQQVLDLLEREVFAQLIYFLAQSAHLALVVLNGDFRFLKDLLVLLLFVRSLGRLVGLQSRQKGAYFLHVFLGDVVELDQNLSGDGLLFESIFFLLEIDPGFFLLFLLPLGLLPLPLQILEQSGESFLSGPFLESRLLVEVVRLSEVRRSQLEFDFFVGLALLEGLLFDL